MIPARRYTQEPNRAIAKVERSALKWNLLSILIIENPKKKNAVVGVNMKKRTFCWNKHEKYLFLFFFRN